MSKKEEIAERVQQIYLLNETIRQNQIDNRNLNSKMNQDVEYNIDQHLYLSSQFEQERNIFEERLLKKEDIKRAELEKLNEDRGQELRDLKLRVDDLNNELNPLRPFHERERLLQEKIELLKKEERDKELAHHDELQRQEKDQSQKLIQMDNIAQAKIDDNKKSAQKAAEKDARDREQRKIEDNKLLRQQLIIKQREVQEMRRERDDLLKQNKNFKLNLQVNKEGILEYQVVNQRQESKIKKLKDEVEQFKLQISNDVTNQTKNLEFMKLQDKQKKEELSSQIEFLKNELKIKGEELKRVRKLAEIIVDQRADIESFFLEALSNVKEQINQKYKINKRSSSSNNNIVLKLPELSIKSQLTNQQQEDSKQNNTKQYQDKVDISELDLEEKEKLLRILFKKMNLGVQPLAWEGNR